MPQIIRIKDLKNTSEISELCHKTNRDMVLMSMELYENTMRQTFMYQNIAFSKKQIKYGQVKEARSALWGLRAKYGL